MCFVEEPGDTFVPNTVICITKKVGDKKIFGNLKDINDECHCNASLSWLSMERLLIWNVF